VVEKILFKVSQNSWVILILLFFLLAISIVINIITRKLKINKTNISIYGLLLGLSNKDILMISLITIKTVLVICNAWRFYTEEIMVSAVMIFIASIIYMFLCGGIKNILFELISTMAQIIAVLLVNELNGYLIEVNNSIYILMIRLLISMFISIYVMFFFIKNFQSVIINNNKRREKAYGKKG